MRSKGFLVEVVGVGCNLLPRLLEAGWVGQNQSKHGSHRRVGRGLCQAGVIKNLFGD